MLVKLICDIFILFQKVWDRCWMFLFSNKFRQIGKNVIFHPMNSSFTYKNICIGNHVFIGDNARFWCTLSSITIKDHVIFAPNVSIIAGNHSYHVVGKWITAYTNSDKRKEDDLPVVIDRDV